MRDPPLDVFKSASRESSLLDQSELTVWAPLLTSQTPQVSPPSMLLSFVLGFCDTNTAGAGSAYVGSENISVTVSGCNRASTPPREARARSSTAPVLGGAHSCVRCSHQGLGEAR